MPCDFVAWLIFIGDLLALSLVAYGVFLAPATNPRSIAGAGIVLLGYAAIGWLVVPRLRARNSADVEAAQWAGLGSGAVFAAEIRLEYVLLPDDNTRWD